MSVTDYCCAANGWTVLSAISVVTEMSQQRSKLIFLFFSVKGIIMKTVHSEMISEVDMFLDP